MTGSDDAFEAKQSRVERRRRRRRLAGRVLPDALVDRLFSEAPIREFERRRAAVKGDFDSLAERLRENVRGVEDRLETARDHPEPFEFDTESIRIRLDNCREAIAELDALDEGYLTREERAERTELREAVASVEEAFVAFENVGREVGTAERRLERAREELEPFGIESWEPRDPETPPEELPRYLTRRATRSVARELARAIQHLDAARAEIRSAGIGERYLDDVDATFDRVRALDAYLTNYNEWYVEREKSLHESQFTDIDAAGHDLSPEQRDAVVRDDKYNLVVAGAGSGKTVVLTHRAAYLTRREDRVLPEDILAITYTSNAAGVMETRLAREFGINNIDAGTFHSIGLNVIEEATGKRPEIVDERDRMGMIRRFVNQEMELDDSRFQREFVRFLRHYHALSEDAEVEQEGAAADAGGLTTLRGDEARSESEKRIADFLFANDLQYEYRVIQDWFEEAEGRGQYRPTFWLPEYDVVISHHPVGADGSPTAWAEAGDHETLRADVDWERARLSERPAVDLVETYEFEYDTGNLPSALVDRLSAIGVPLDRRPITELIDEAYDNRVNRHQIFSLFDSFIVNAKQLDLSPDAVERRIDRDTTPRKEAFEACAAQLYRQYVVQLHELEAVDYPDMLHRAADHMEEHPDEYQSRYDQILVDEFQDISAAQVRLLKCFVTPTNDTHLFCVGDDWQSIYSFSGSDVSYFIEFADVFSEPTRSDLTANYRCPETVVEAGDALIANNDRQIAKRTRPKSGTDTRIDVYDLETAPDTYGYNEVLVERTADLVERARENGTPPGEILVLSRSKVFYEDLAEACARRGIQAATDADKKPNPAEWVRLYSVHKSKGDEAEHVIITHAVEDTIGFPSQVEDSDLLDPVRINPESDATAEERRLFYVALTRTTGKLDIVSAVGNRSRFLDEIEAHLSPAPVVAALGDNESRTDVAAARVTELFDTGDAVAQSGLLSDWSGTRKFTIFDPEETPLLDRRGTYRIEGARLDEFRGDYSLVLDDRTTVEPVDPVEAG